MTIKGIEHVGITVPEIEAAERFFREAFGAETLYALIERGEDGQDGAEMRDKNGLEPGTRIVAMRMLRLANGANVELFEVEGAHGDVADGPSRYGLHHIAVYVDDLDEAAARFTAAGGAMLDGPIELGGKERGPGNRCWFGITPWRMPVELIDLPSPLALEDEAKSGPRWLPG